MSILCSGYSQQCVNKDHVNQDKFGSIRLIDSNGKEITVSVVADGISLGFEGKYASYNIVLWLINWAVKYFETNCFSIEELAAELQNQMVMYNHILNEFSEKNSDRDTCSTVCGFITDEDEILIFNAGDSRLYELNSASDIRCLTMDDKAEDGYSIAMHVGGKNDSDVHISFSRERYNKESKYVLCTDGFYKSVDFSSLCNQLDNVCDRNNTIRIISEYVSSLVANGETDDITALIMSKG